MIDERYISCTTITYGAVQDDVPSSDMDGSAILGVTLILVEVTQILHLHLQLLHLLLTALKLLQQEVVLHLKALEGMRIYTVL